MTVVECDEAVQVLTAWLEARGETDVAARLWKAVGVGERRPVPVPNDVEHLVYIVDVLLVRLGYEELAMDVALATDPEREHGNEVEGCGVCEVLGLGREEEGGRASLRCPSHEGDGPP